jgi:SOS-response transcriptional repressor LexA
MSRHQKQRYQFIRQYIQRHGFPPSLDEMGTHCAVNRSTILRLLDGLEGQGRILRQSNRPGSIRLPDLDRRWEMEHLIDTFIDHYHLRYDQMPNLGSIINGCGLAESFVIGYLNQTGRITIQHR